MGVLIGGGKDATSFVLSSTLSDLIFFIVKCPILIGTDQIPRNDLLLRWISGISSSVTVPECSTLIKISGFGDMGGRVLGMCIDKCMDMLYFYISINLSKVAL